MTGVMDIREDMDARDSTLINTNIVTPPSTGFGTAMGSSLRVSDWQSRYSVLTDKENCPRIPKKTRNAQHHLPAVQLAQ